MFGQAGETRRLSKISTKKDSKKQEQKLQGSFLAITYNHKTMRVPPLIPCLRHALLLLVFAPLLLVANAQQGTSSTPVDPNSAENPVAEEPATENGAATPIVDEALLGVSNFGEYLQKGGILMTPLAILAFITIVLIIFSALTVRRSAVVSDRFMDTAEHFLRKEDALGLLTTCSRRGEAISRVCQKAIEFASKNPNATFAEVRDVAETEGFRQANLLSQRISYLADVGAIAPMMGLLGTVLGMIEAFQDIEDHTMNAHAGFAGGVAIALITTATGLVIGIPALIFYSIFRSRVAKYISELESASTHIIALMGASYNRRSQEKNSV